MDIEYNVIQNKHYTHSYNGKFYYSQLTHLNIIIVCTILLLTVIFINSKLNQNHTSGKKHTNFFTTKFVFLLEELSACIALVLCLWLCVFLYFVSFVLLLPGYISNNVQHIHFPQEKINFRRSQQCKYYNKQFTFKWLCTILLLAHLNWLKKQNIYIPAKMDTLSRKQFVGYNSVVCSSAVVLFQNVLYTFIVSSPKSTTSLL